MASNDRFVAVGEEEMERLLSDKDSKNTKRKISSSLKYFRTFLAKNYQNHNFESFTCDVLDDRLKAFYAGSRKTDGTQFKKTALQSIRYGVKKHIVETMDLDISDKTRFPNSNKMYEAVLVDMKKKGLGVVDNKPPIAQDDLKKTVFK
jgi:hypothetical protein